MTQAIEFNCKYENAGKPCSGKVIYKPEVLFKVTARTESMPPKPRVPGASGQMEDVYLKCDKGHRGPYKIVKFPCQEQRCDKIVVGTGEGPPVYPKHDRRVKDGKLKLTCDRKHEYTYQVVESGE